MVCMCSLFGCAVCPFTGSIHDLCACMTYVYVSWFVCVLIICTCSWCVCLWFECCVDGFGVSSRIGSCVNDLCVCVFMIGVTAWLVRVCGVRLCRRMQQHRVFIRVIRQSMGSSFLAIILILKFRDNVAYWCQIPKREYNRNRAAPWNGSLESLDVSHARETDLIDPILALWDVSHDMFSADV